MNFQLLCLIDFCSNLFPVELNLYCTKTTLFDVCPVFLVLNVLICLSHALFFFFSNYKWDEIIFEFLHIKKFYFHFLKRFTFSRETKEYPSSTKTACYSMLTLVNSRGKSTLAEFQCRTVADEDRREDNRYKFLALTSHSSMVSPILSRSMIGQHRCRLMDPSILCHDL